MTESSLRWLINELEKLYLLKIYFNNCKKHSETKILSPILIEPSGIKKCESLKWVLDHKKVENCCGKQRRSKLFNVIIISVLTLEYEII